MTHAIQFVSLGPGDPELITLKAFKALQQADIIFCPGTSNKEGSLSSRAAEIIRELNIETPIHIFHVPMSKDRSKAIQAYNTLSGQIQTNYHAGKKIAIVAEGDSGFYSSIQYLYDQLTTTSIPVNRIAGIPAFIAAGAVAGIHIVKQEEQLHIIPGKTTIEELSSLIEKKQTIVIMKLSQCRETIQECITQYPRLKWHYFENIGLPNQYYTTNTTILKERNIPYFSLLIIQNEK